MKTVIYIFVSRFFDEYEVQKNSIYLKYKDFVALNTTVEKFGVSKKFYILFFWGKKKNKAILLFIKVELN